MWPDGEGASVRVVVLSAPTHLLCHHSLTGPIPPFRISVHSLHPSFIATYKLYLLLLSLSLSLSFFSICVSNCHPSC